MSEQQRSPKPGIAYKKTSKAGASYVSISLDVSVIEQLIADNNGAPKLKLTMFTNNSENRTNTTPDYNIVAPSKEGSSQGKQGVHSARPTGKSNPFI